MRLKRSVAALAVVGVVGSGALVSTAASNEAQAKRTIADRLPSDHPGTHTKRGGDKRTVYLTFDDGPSGGTNGYTAKVLDALEAGGAHATFFQTGRPYDRHGTYATSGMASRAVDNKPLVLRALAEGNQIGTHTWDHPHMPQLTCAEQQLEITRARDYQKSITGGYDSKLFRYPYFDNDPRCGDQFLSRLGVQTIYGDVSPDDWNARVGDNAVVSRVAGHVFDGAIVTLHDGTDVLDRGAPTYLPKLIQKLKSQGYAFGVLGR